MGRLAGAVRHPLTDGPPTFDQHHLDGQPGLSGTSEGLGRRDGPAEAAPHDDDGRRAIRLPSRDLARGLWSGPELADVPQRRRVHMHRHERLVGRGRVADRMHAGVLSGQDLAAAHGRLVLQVHVAVGRHMVTAFDRLPLHDVHGADGAGMIVRHAGLAGEPGHHEQIVRVPHHHRGAVVAPRVRLDVSRHIGRRQARSLQGMTEGSQRGLLAQAIQFTHQLEKAAVQASHESPPPSSMVVGPSSRCSIPSTGRIRT